MDRYSAISQICAALAQIRRGPSAWSDYTFSCSPTIETRFRFIDEINAFPHISVVADSERIVHSRSGERFSQLVLQIRGYVHGDHSYELAEALVDDIEHVLTHYRQWSTGIDECRLDTTRTDGGLNAPLGAVMISATVIYTR